MVDVHGGFTLIPELLLPYLQKDQLENVRAFNSPVPAREISIITRRLSHKEKQIEVLKAEILKGVTKHLSKHKRMELLPID